VAALNAALAKRRLTRPFCVRGATLIIRAATRLSQARMMRLLYHLAFEGLFDFHGEA
jgi:hypothetical protein